MPEANVYTPLALKLHSFGLRQLFDPNWTGMVLFDKLKQHVRGRQEPFDLLRKTLREGLLYHLGLWLYDEYLEEEYFESLKDEYAPWYLEDLVGLLRHLGCSSNDALLDEAETALTKIDDLYNLTDDEEYFEYLTSVEGIEALGDLRRRILETHASEISEARAIHAENYAERVFHDRQLCEHISRTLVLIGFDGKDINDAEPKQWIDRIEWPEWAKKAVRARDRSVCASCGVNIGGELMANEQFDHIVPLSRAGTNDLCNLQLLCDSCNNKKSANQIDVASSVPRYLNVGRRSPRT